MAISSKKQAQGGLALIIAIITATVTFSIGLSLLDTAIRQLALSNISKDSEIAFHAAHAGMECARFIDITNKELFTVSPYSPISTKCMEGLATTSIGEVTSSGSGDKARYEYKYDWGTSPGLLCSSVTIYKYEDGADRSGEVPSLAQCPEDVTCTTIKSRGYNSPCNQINDSLTIEREIVIIY